MSKSNITTIAIVGRPNVGKSTLYNRLIKKRKAIENSESGTTRDRLYNDLFWRGQKYRLIDTAGIMTSQSSDLEKEAQESTQIAIEEADVILFLVNYRQGVTEQDIQIAKKLKKHIKTILVVNKCDSNFDLQNLKPFYRLGVDKKILLSAISGRNSGDLLDMIHDLSNNDIQIENKPESNDDEIRMAIIGRPNAGKSTLLNTIIGEKKMITSDLPGTTRDAQEFEFNHKGKKIIICDTAGLKRKSKVKMGSADGYALLKSYHAISDSQVVVYLLDGREGIAALDQTLLGDAAKEGKSIILAINKIDLWQETEEKMAIFIAKLQQELNFMPWLPIIFISALKNKNIDKLLDQVKSIFNERFFSVSEEDCNQILYEARTRNSQIFYITKLFFARNNPIVFKIITKKNKKPHFSHLRYLENRIRDKFPYRGTPLFIDWLRK